VIAEGSSIALNKKKGLGGNARLRRKPSPREKRPEGSQTEKMTNWGGGGNVNHRGGGEFDVGYNYAGYRVTRI